MKIAEDRGEELPIGVTIGVVDRHTVQENAAGFLLIEPQQQQGQCGLAAPIAADQKSHLAGAESQIDGTNSERPLISFGRMVMRNADQVEPAPPTDIQLGPGLSPICFATRCRCREGQAQRIDFVQRHIGTPETGQQLDDLRKRTHHVQQHQRGADHRIDGHRPPRRPQEQQRPDGGVKQKQAPAGSDGVHRHAADEIPFVRLHRSME